MPDLLYKIFPALNWLIGYKKAWLSSDIRAGFSTAVLLIPQGLAYAVLAGMPPVTGLYAALIPLIIYAVFGSSRQLSIGPVAIDSMLVAAGVGLIAQSGTNAYFMLCAATAIIAGLLQFMAGTLGLGYMVNFLSMPVISGFTSAAAFIIGASQLKHLLGIDADGGPYLFSTLRSLVTNAETLNFVALLIGLSGIVALLLLRKFLPKAPAALIVAALATLCVWLFDLHTYNLAIVGYIPKGLPSLSIPEFQLQTISELLPLAVTISLMGFMESVALGKRFAAIHHYALNASQELKSLGLTNIAAGFSGAFPVAGSFARSALNDQSGAKTQLASVVNALIILLTLLFLTPLFFYIPLAVLAAIIIVTVYGLIDFKETRRLFKIKRVDFYILLFSFGATLILGMQYGIFAGIVASIVMIMQRISAPHTAQMGQIPGSETLRNFKRDKNATNIDGLFIFRIDASLYFANIFFLQEYIETHTLDPKTQIKAVIFDASSVTDIDSSADAGLHSIAETLKKRGIELYITNVKGPVRDMMKVSGFQQKLGKDHFFLNKKAAVRHFQSLN